MSNPLTPEDVIDRMFERFAQCIGLIVTASIIGSWPVTICVGLLQTFGGHHG